MSIFENRVLVRVLSLYEPESTFGGRVYRNGQIGYVTGDCNAATCSGAYDVHVSFTSWDDDSICMNDSDLEVVSVMPEPEPEPESVEWCVVYAREPEAVHRGPWPREEAVAWIEETVEDGFLPGTFLLASRVVSEWKVT